MINVPIAITGLALAISLVPDSRKAAAPPPDITGAALSVAGLGLVVWSIIEAPVRGWSSGIVINAGTAGVAVLAGFALWERASPHPMLSLSLFRRGTYSGAVSSVWLVTFGLFGALFVLTQYLQFSLCSTALQTGIRVLPAAGAVAVVAPVSAAIVRMIGAAAGAVVAAAWGPAGTARAEQLRGEVAIRRKGPIGQDLRASGHDSVHYRRPRSTR